MTLLEFDENIKQGGNKFRKQYDNIIGTDEVGRGSIAGPVVACAVCILEVFPELSLVNDSKKLTAKKREKIYDLILKNEDKIKFSIKLKSALEIDNSNILKMSLEAMSEAVEDIYLNNSIILVDGNKEIKTKHEQEIVIKGDSKSLSIATASIIAKVYRDSIMKSIEPDLYDFKNNMGYGTKKHYEMLDKFGQSKYHRRTFLNKYYEKNTKNTLF